MCENEGEGGGEERRRIIALCDGASTGATLIRVTWSRLSWISVVFKGACICREGGWFRSNREEKNRGSPNKGREENLSARI